jgi:hypothetical protein
VKQIEVDGQKFGLNATWGAKLAYQEKLATYFDTVNSTGPNIATANIGWQRLRAEYLANVLCEVDGAPVKAPADAVNALDADTVEKLFDTLGISGAFTRAEGNAEAEAQAPPDEEPTPDSASPPAPGFEDSP